MELWDLVCASKVSTIQLGRVSKYSETKEHTIKHEWVKAQGHSFTGRGSSGKIPVVSQRRWWRGGPGGEGMSLLIPPWVVEAAELEH